MDDVVKEGGIGVVTYVYRAVCSYQNKKNARIIHATAAAAYARATRYSISESIAQVHASLGVVHGRDQGAVEADAVDVAVPLGHPRRSSRMARLSANPELYMSVVDPPRRSRDPEPVCARIGGGVVK